MIYISGAFPKVAFESDYRRRMVFESFTKRRHDFLACSPHKSARFCLGR